MLNTNYTIISYHVFADGVDEWVETIGEAASIVRKWYKEGHQRIRIWKETTFNCRTEQQSDAEDYVWGLGDYPW